MYAKLGGAVRKAREQPGTQDLRRNILQPFHRASRGNNEFVYCRLHYIHILQNIKRFISGSNYYS